jgi:putative transposase
MPKLVSHKCHHFPPKIIAHAVWLYFRFPLSLRLIEEMLLEPGMVVSYETIRRWGRKFGSAYARRLRRKPPRPNDIWHLDEVAISIAGRKHWLWRAVDQYGYVLDEIVQSRRNTKDTVKLARDRVCGTIMGMSTMSNPYRGYRLSISRRFSQHRGPV